MPAGEAGTFVEADAGLVAEDGDRGVTEDRDVGDGLEDAIGQAP
jgi:hypothetical protein